MDQIAELLEENQEDEDHDNDREHIDIVMMPPEELDGAVSEGDSDESDSPLASINNLSKKILLGGAEVVKGRGAVSADSETLDKELNRNENDKTEEKVDEEENLIPVEIRSVRSDSEGSRSGNSVLTRQACGPSHATLRGRGRGLGRVHVSSRGHGGRGGGKVGRGHAHVVGESSSGDNNNNKRPARGGGAAKRSRGRSVQTVRGPPIREDRVRSDETSSDSEPEVLQNQAKNKTKNPEYNRVWYGDDQGVGSKILTTFQPPENQADSDLVKSCKSPYHFYRLMQPESHIQQVVEQSKMYAHQQGHPSKAALVNVDTMMCSQAVMLLSGYNKLPSKRMYWEESPDSFNKLVAENIRRETFEAVLFSTHFADNNNLDPDDRFAKVRLVISNINAQKSEIHANQKRSLCG